MLPGSLPMTYQAVGTGVGGHTDAGGKGAALSGGQPLPKLFCQEGHQWGEQAQTNICTGEQDLWGSWGTGRTRQHWLHRFLRRELTGNTTAMPQPWVGVYVKLLNITDAMLAPDVCVNRPSDSQRLGRRRGQCFCLQCQGQNSEPLSTLPGQVYHKAMPSALEDG